MSLNYEEIMDRWGETQTKLNDAQQRIAELERELQAIIDEANQSLYAADCPDLSRLIDEAQTLITKGQKS